MSDEFEIKLFVETHPLTTGQLIKHIKTNREPLVHRLRRFYCSLVGHDRVIREWQPIDGGLGKRQLYSGCTRCPMARML